MPASAVALARPLPPPSLLSGNAPFPRFVRGEELEEWARAMMISPDGALHNPDHSHLRIARLGVLWTDAQPRDRGRTIVATAERPNPRGQGFSKAQARWVLGHFFGSPAPDFVLTFSTRHAAEADDASWCALVEHELYHCAHARDRWGTPKFDRRGRPVFTIRGHDVEEFVGVVRRYGAAASGPDTEALVEAAQAGPTVAQAAVAGACGTCLRAAA